MRDNGSLPVWQRDDQRGPMALRITKDGLHAIDAGMRRRLSPRPEACRFRKSNPGQGRLHMPRLQQNGFKSRG